MEKKGGIVGAVYDRAFPKMRAVIDRAYNFPSLFPTARPFLPGIDAWRFSGRRIAAPQTLEIGTDPSTGIGWTRNCLPLYLCQNTQACRREMLRRLAILFLISLPVCT